MSCWSWNVNVKESSPVNLIEYLPDDLLLNCLARISRSYHKTLSLVSKRFRSLLLSTELYQTRKLLGINEKCLYICLDSHWFTLNQVTTRNPRWFTSPCTRRNLLISVQRPSFPHRSRWDVAAVNGFNIYMIGKCSTKVSVMDCRSHTWHEAPSMQVARKHPLVSVVDGKIYVVEGYPDYNYSNFMEFFDPETQKWEHAPSPGPQIGRRFINRCLAKEGNLYLLGDKVMIYKPKENKWDVRFGVCFVENLDTCCTIDNIKYRCYTRTLEWYDSEERCWRDLKGLKGLHNKLSRWYYGYVRLMNYGGNILLAWEEYFVSQGCRKIWCAEIEIKNKIKRGKCGQEIRGKVKWCDVVLTVPITSSFKIVVATV